jgi:hypothetical protein
MEAALNELGSPISKAPATDFGFSKADCWQIFGTDGGT